MSLNLHCKRYLSVFVISLAAISTLAPTPAHARARGILFFNTGEELFEVGDFPQNMVNEYPGLKDYKMSYLCQRFGLFWADIWTWDCKLMAANTSSNTVSDIPQELALPLQQQYPFDKAQRSFWSKYGILTMMIAFMVVFILQGKKETNAETPKTEQ
jgi:hypothetical protein